MTSTSPVRKLPDLDEVFRIAFEHFAAGITVTAATGEYLHANPAFCEFVGYSLDELRALTDSDLLPKEEHDMAARVADRLLRGEERDSRWERRFIHKSGRHLWALRSSTLVRDNDGAPAYFISQVIDISARKQAEEALQRSEAHARALIESMHDVVLVLDRDGTYLDVPSIAPDKLYPREDVIGRRIHDIFPRDQADAFLATVVKALDTHKPVELAYDLDIRGETVSFEAIVSPLPDDRVVFVARDVTPRKRAEQALRESEDQLRQAQKMEAVGQLAGGIAHDFNNLLMAIMSNAELAALELKAGSQVSQHIDEIKNASRRARSLTQQLLAYSRKQMLQPRVLDLNAVVRDAEQILRRLIGENITMTVTLDPWLGQVRADPGQVVQVLMNLAVNARDAMPKGGGQLIIESDNRDIGAAEAQAHRGLREGRYVALLVRDSGIGMDEDTKARIFEPFFTTKPPGQGTGLGLSTAYGIVKQSGGYIAVDSAPGFGTTFTILLPRVFETSDTAGVVAQPETTVAGSRGTVLLVEDEGAVREATKRMLRKFGFSVIEAKHGQDAVQLFEREADSVDVVLTDVVMPAMGGAELARLLRERRPNLRVVFMSGYTQGTLEISTMDEAATRFLPKPFTADQLVGALRELMD